MTTRRFSATALLILLIPVWLVLYGIACIGALAGLLWDRLYHPLYDAAFKSD